MRYTTIGISARLGLLLLTAGAVWPVRGQNQTPANVAPAMVMGAWKDPSTGLMWTLQDNGFDINQTDALNYCRNLSLGGLRDWRLAEIDELAGIYDASVVSGDWAAPNGNRLTLHVKGGIQMTSILAWSATRGNRPGQALSFYFSGGGRPSFPESVSGGGRALCVRRARE